MPADTSWWRNAVLYQIYPRSWSDSDGDGIGDLPGIMERLDHLAWLGVDAIWLNPTMPSPNADWGYDVSDYRGVHPDLGTLEDLDRLIAAAHERDVRVLLDLVPNHTSSQHPWFVEARKARSSDHRDWYVWADQSDDGGPPNNWLSTFGGPAWELDEATGQYYMHNFLAEQPDLHWWNGDVRSEFDSILRFWFDRGVAGFRIDVAHALIADRELRDNPAPVPEDHPEIRRLGQQQMFNMNRPEVHDILRRWRSVGGEYPDPRILLGETYVFDLEQLASFHGSSEDELHLCLNVPFLLAEGFSEEQWSILLRTIDVLSGRGVPLWTGSNHDAGRFATRWSDDSDDLIRCALVLMLMLPGAVSLYYGDEIGLPDVAIDRADVLDPVGIREWPDGGRDKGRTPMHWTGEPKGGFTTGDDTWLPMGETAHCNVADQRDDRTSILHLCRELIALRKSHDDLRAGSFSSVDDRPWMWRRGGVVVAINPSSAAVRLPVVGRVLISSHRDMDGARITELELAGRSAAVVENASGHRDGKGMTP